MDIYFAIAEPNRRMILEDLALHGQLTASEIAQKFQITSAAISQHLKVLFEAGLVNRRKEAQKRIYEINKEGFTELDQWRESIKQTWESRLENLDNLLQESN